MGTLLQAAEKLGMSTQVLKFIDMQCPKCNKKLRFVDWSIIETMGVLGAETVKCPTCNDVIDAGKFRFIPHIGL